MTFFHKIALALLVISAPAMAQTEEAKSQALQIANATVTPDRIVTDATARFKAEFDAGVQRGLRGRTLPPGGAEYLARQKAEETALLAQLLRNETLPKALSAVAAHYLRNFSPDELKKAAAFWTSPAGAALTRASQDAMLQGNQTVVFPREHVEEINRYLRSETGRKDTKLAAGARVILQQQLLEFQQEIQVKLRGAARQSPPIRRQ
jgi:hypothetical protein